MKKVIMVIATLIFLSSCIVQPVAVPETSQETSSNDATQQQNQAEALPSESSTQQDKGEEESEAEAPIPDPIVYSGSGDDVISVEMPDDQCVFYIEGNEEERHFSVKGYAANDKSTGLFVNTTQAYSGITFDSDFKTVTMEISSNGDWLIEIRSLRSCRTVAGGETITGTGDEVLLVTGDPSKAIIEGNEEARHFAVKSYGKRNNLMVNTSDEYSGTVLIKGDPKIIEVSAKGEWSIELE